MMIELKAMLSLLHMSMTHISCFSHLICSPLKSKLSRAECGRMVLRKLIMNMSKTATVVVGSKRSPVEFPNKINDEIMVSSSVKFSGLHLDQHLKRNDHLESTFACEKDLFMWNTV